MTTNLTNILILGGGYGGVMAALRLAGRTKGLDVTITLVNAHAHFVERPRLHEQATGEALAARPLTQMLRGTSVRFLQGKVVAIEPNRDQVTVEMAENTLELPYDYLISALGSRTNRSNVPGVADHAYTLDADGERTTAALQAKLESIDRSTARVVVVGGGATGIEAATQIKSRYPQCHVTLVSQGQVGAFKGARVQKQIAGALTGQSITVHEHRHVERVRADSIGVTNQMEKDRTSPAEQIPADVVIWAGGFVASPLARQAGLRVNSQGQLLVDPMLRSLSHPNIFGVGDVACPVEEPGAPMRMSLFTALVSGAQAAENLAALIKGTQPQPLSFVWYGQGIALGSDDAIGFATYPADRAWPLIFRRRVAVHVRNFFVWYLGFALEMERRFPGSFFWNGKKRFARQQRRQRSAGPLTVKG